MGGGGRAVSLSPRFSLAGTNYVFLNIELDVCFYKKQSSVVPSYCKVKS